MSRLRILIAVALVGTLLTLTAGTAVAARHRTGSITTPVTGTLDNGSTFAGTLTINSFKTVNGAVNAVGTVAGTITSPTTAATQAVPATAVSIPVSGLAVNGSCSILHLELGPLDLNLLGLVVHLDKVVLDISAQPGSGNLLGNLLCALAGLLDNGGPLSGITALLNQILGILGNLNL